MVNQYKIHIGLINRGFKMANAVTVFKLTSKAALHKNTPAIVAAGGVLPGVRQQLLVSIVLRRIRVQCQ